MNDKTANVVDQTTKTDQVTMEQSVPEFLRRPATTLGGAEIVASQEVVLQEKGKKVPEDRPAN